MAIRPRSAAGTCPRAWTPAPSGHRNAGPQGPKKPYGGKPGGRPGAGAKRTGSPYGERGQGGGGFGGDRFGNDRSGFNAERGPRGAQGQQRSAKPYGHPGNAPSFPSDHANPGFSPYGQPRGSAFGTETVLDVRHWTDDYFSFTTTRDDGFRFDNGQFVMIGLEVDGRPLLRAYSIASANWEEQLEFFSIKVPDGPLTSRLQHIRPGDTVLIGRKPTGTLLISDLHPGRNLYLLGTGTGLAPWLAMIKDPETYERFETA
jgi:hypothetical protein